MCKKRASNLNHTKWNFMEEIIQLERKTIAFVLEWHILDCSFQYFWWRNFTSTFVIARDLMYLGRFRDFVDPISKIECDWSSRRCSQEIRFLGNHAKIFRVHEEVKILFRESKTSLDIIFQYLNSRILIKVTQHGLIRS